MYMIERFTHLIIKQRFFVILISLLVVTLAALSLPKTKFSSDYRIYFSDDNPHLQAYEDLQATFTKSDNVMPCFYTIDSGHYRTTNRDGLETPLFD